METISRCNFLSRPRCAYRIEVTNKDWDPVCRGRGCGEAVTQCYEDAYESMPCPNIVEGFCKAYTNPAAKWKTDKEENIIQRCNLIERKVAVAEKKKVNPLKASKRAKKGKE